MLNDEDWNFVPVPLVFAQSAEETSEATERNALEENFPAKNAPSDVLNVLQSGFSGSLWKNGSKVEGVSCRIEHFNFSEGPCDLFLGDESFLRFYYSEVWTQFFRLAPGTSLEPVRYFGTLVLASGDFEIELSPKSMKIHDFLIQACLSYISIKFKKDGDFYEFYLTNDGNMYYSPAADRNLRFFMENADKIDKHALKIAKKKAKKASSFKSGLKFAKIVSKTFFLDKTVDKIGIIAQYSDQISDINKEFYTNQYELIKFILKSSDLQ